MSTAAPVEVKEPEASEVTDLARPWKVIVWNDPINLMSYVTFVSRSCSVTARRKPTSS